MKFAVISDVHANKEALEAVLEDIDKQGVERIFCLGDIVGYGPDPLDVIELIKNHTDFCIRGNHDEMITRNTLYTDNPIAKISLNYSLKALRPRENILSFLDNQKNRREKDYDFLSSLIEKKTFYSNLFVHGSPGKNRYDYLTHPGNAFKALKESWEENVCFVGHTHIPFYSNLVDKMLYFENENLDEFKVKGKVLVNVGSVGQPRDQDNRSCYVICDDETVRFRRVDYDYEKTMYKLMKMGKKERMVKPFERLAHRLEIGK